MYGDTVEVFSCVINTKHHKTTCASLPEHLTFLFSFIQQIVCLP